MHSFLQSFAIAFLGSMLPRKEEIQSHLNLASKGVVWLAAGGILLGGTMLGLLSGGYFLLVEAGQSHLSAGIITTLLALLLAMAFLRVGDTYVKNSANIVDSMHLRTAKLPVIEARVDLAEAATSLWDAFLKGYHTQKETEYYTERYTAAQQDAEMAELYKRLQELKERIELERQHIEAHARMEAAIQANKDIIRFRPRDSR